MTAAVLTDFGIATMAGDPALTQVGMVFGTPGFTAPERLHGDPATPASDLWSLGATLYMAVEGRGPFERPGGSAAIIAGVAGEPAPRAPSAGPLGPVIDALLQADPARRPDAATAAAMLADASAGPDRAEGLREPSLRGQPDAGWPSPVGTPRFSDQPGAGPRSFLDAPSLLDQPEFLYQSGLLNPPGTSTGGPPSGVRDDAAPGFSPPHRRRWRGLLGRGRLPGRGGRGKRAAITAVAVIAAGLAGYAAYPRPAGLDVTSPPTVQGQTPATGTGTGSNVSRGSQPAGRDTASPAGSAPARGTGQSTSSGPDGTGGTAGAGSTGSTAGDDGAGGAPAGYRWYQVTAAASGTVAGFEIAVPDPWQASQPGLDSILRSPDSNAFIEVSLAPFRYTQPLREAEFRQAQAIRHDPGYHLAAMRTGTFLGGADAVWEFSRRDAGTKVSVEELLVTVDTTAGAQPYALTVSAPSASFGPALAVFRQALATFQPVP